MGCQRPPLSPEFARGSSYPNPPPPKGRFGGVALFGFIFKSYSPNHMIRRALSLHEHGACSEKIFHVKISFKKIFIAMEVPKVLQKTWYFKVPEVGPVIYLGINSQKSPSPHVCDHRDRSTHRTTFPFSFASYICSKEHPKHKQWCLEMRRKFFRGPRASLSRFEKLSF